MTFRITWSTPAGRFGWVEVSECVDLDDALNHWLTEVRGVTVPFDADIDQIQQIAS